MLTSADVAERLKEVVGGALYDTHEEEINESFWQKQRESYSSVLEDLPSSIAPFKELPSRPSYRLLILLGGCLGNSLSTRKLCNPGDRLYQLALNTLDSLQQSIGAANIGELFRQDDTASSRRPTFDQLLQEVSLAVSARPPNETDGSPFTKAPLLRDALIWFSLNVNYPVLCDNKQLGLLHPFALQLLEDYRPPVKSCGLQLLKHLSTEVLISSWRSSGRCEATLNVLLTLRSSYASTQTLLAEAFGCIFAFLRLLEPTEKRIWLNKLAEVLFSDLVLEAKLENRVVLTGYATTLTDLLGREIMVHSRRLLKSAELTLLAPRSSNSANLREREHLSFSQMLACLLKFVQLSSDLLFPDLLPMVLPVLTSFVDLEWSRRGNEDVAGGLSTLSSQLTSILSLLLKQNPPEVSKVLNRCVELSPNLQPMVVACGDLYIPACK
nr:unnamed protein product [Spirometra erinaceieuropaei]